MTGRERDPADALVETVREKHAQDVYAALRGALDLDAEFDAALDALAARVAELEAKLASTEADYQAMYEQAADAVARVAELEAALRQLAEQETGPLYLPPFVLARAALRAEDAPEA